MSDERVKPSLLPLLHTKIERYEDREPAPAGFLLAALAIGMLTAAAILTGYTIGRIFL